MNQFKRVIKRELLLLSILFAINGYSQQLVFMGLPINSSKTEFSKVLTAHRFKENPWYWEGGDFWKQRNCFVELYTDDKTHVDKIGVRIPYYNFNTIDEYSNTIVELLSDLSNKYGQYVCDTLDIEKDYDAFLHPTDHKDDLYYVFSWNCSNGDLKVMVNANRIYAILIQYQSIEYINRRKEAARFKGQGSSDL